jgi:protein MpaA
MHRRTRWACTGALLALLGMGAGAAAGETTSGPEVIGRSVQGRAITAVHLGADDAPVRLVVIGQMHGDEPAGRRVVAALAGMVPAAQVQLWLVPTLNPDGAAASRRTNAHRVDLNRNFPEGWARTQRSIYFSGPRASSEPETRAAMAFLERVQPTAVLSFHQAFARVDNTQVRSRAAAAQLSRLIGLPAGTVSCPSRCRGTMTGWIDASLEAIAITVELRSRVSSASAAHAARAVLGLGSWLAAPVSTPPPMLVPSPTPTPTPTSSPEPAASPTSSATQSPVG